MDAMLYWFRRMAGFDAPGTPYTGHFEYNIKGQTAGLFFNGRGQCPALDGGAGAPKA